jgi:hypothetical protein
VPSAISQPSLKRQALGTVGSEGLLQFQLRSGKTPQNPSRWLAR